jgi:hypothetical protein
MDTIELRREAEFCLRLMQLWSDRSLARRLSFLAARYHEAALRAELGLPALHIPYQRHDRSVLSSPSVAVIAAHADKSVHARGEVNEGKKAPV